MSLLTSSAIISGFTLLSRVFGFIRDMLIAFILGASIYTDAFFVAFKLPNFLRRLFAEGAFTAAFLPMFAGLMKTEGEDEAKRFASQAMAALLSVLIPLTLLATLAMPWIILLLAPGFEGDPEKYQLTVSLSRITFIYIVFISMVSLLSGILNSHNRFAAVAATPILLNFSLIGAVLFLPPYVPNPAFALAVGVVIAGIAQFLWLAVFCYRSRILPRLTRPRLTERMRKLLSLIAPAAVGAGVAQVNLLIDVILASLFSNAVSWLYYADRLYELPLGVIGIAVATALLPMLSKLIRSGDMAEASRQLSLAVMLVLVFGLPAAVGLFCLAEQLISTIFEHGEFAAVDTAATAPALMAYAVGLPAFLLVKIFANCFYAAQDTKTPVRIAMLCVAINLCGNLIFMQYFEHVGLAMATSLAGWINAFLLSVYLYKRQLWTPSRQLMLFLLKSVLACTLMSVVILIIPAAPYFTAESLLYEKIVALTVLIFSGAGAYFLTLHMVHALPRGTIKAFLQKPPQHKRTD